MPADEHEIVLHNDGTWDPLPPKKDELNNFSYKPVPPTPAKVNTTLSVIDSDTESSNPTPGPSGQPSGSSPPGNIDCITLDSDSEEEEETPPNKRIRLGSSSETTSNTDGPGSPDLICLDDD